MITYRGGDVEELHSVIVGTKGVVKFSTKAPVLQDRLEPG